MLRNTYTNIKRVCTFAFVPRLLRGHAKYSPGKFEKSGAYAAKSTVAGSDDSQGPCSDDHKEQEIRAKRQRIINYIFGTGEYPASDITGFEGIEIHNESPAKENIIPSDALLLSTTRKDNIEKHEDRLIQKIEKIEEPPLVEAEKPKIDSLNTNPKILGDKPTDQPITELRTSRHKGNRSSRVLLSDNTMNPALKSLRRDGLLSKTLQQYNQLVGKPRTVTFYPKGDTLKERLNFSTNDGNRKPGPSPECDLAKSLGQKSNQINERFLDEMEKLSIPATGSKSHNLNGEIVQAEIMGKSKKTAEKPDMDLESRQLEEADRKRLYKLNAVDPLEPDNKQERSKSTLIMPNQLSFGSKTEPPEFKPPIKMEQCNIESTRPSVRPTTPNDDELVGFKMNPPYEPHGNSAGGIPKLSPNPALIEPYDKKTISGNTCLITSVETGRFVEEDLQKPLAHETSRPDCPITIKEVAESSEEASFNDRPKTDEPTLMTSRLKDKILYNIQQNVRGSPKMDQENIKHRSTIDTLHLDTIELEKNRTEFKQALPIEQQQKEQPTQSTQEEQLTNDDQGDTSPSEIIKCETFVPPTVQLQIKPTDATKMAPKTFRTDPLNLQMTEPEIYASDTTPPLNLQTTEPEIYASDTTESQKIKLHTISPDVHQEKEQGNQPQTIEPVRVEPTTEDLVEKTKEDAAKYYMPPACEKIKCNISGSVGPLPLFNPNQEQNIPLSELLVRVRMRSRLEACKVMECTQAEPEAKKCPSPPGCCPPRQPPCCPPPSPCCPPRPPPCCPPPRPCCPPRPPPCCPPSPPPCPCPKPPPCPPPKPCCPPPPCPCPPKPCTPPCPCPICPPPKCEKPRPKCPPCRKPLCPDPCPPKKSDPCRSSSCTGNGEDDALTIILSSRYPKVTAPYVIPILARTLIQSRADDPELVEEGSPDNIVLARDFEPWTPIPCWPHPKKLERRPLVCPKDGCKEQPPPKDGAFCKPSEKPCTHFPKRLTFLSKDMLVKNLGKKKMFDLGHF